MPNRVHVSFGEVQHGWIDVAIGAADVEVRFPASSICPSVDDLVFALRGLLTSDGVGRSQWNSEPAEYEVRLSREGDAFGLEVERFDDWRRDPGRGTLRLSASGSAAQIILPFWRALRGLQARYTEAEWAERWGSPFPTQELAALTRLLGK